MKIWVDDIKPAPEGYIECGSVEEFICIYCNLEDYPEDNIIEELSLDHDAGDYIKFGGDYIEILNFLEEEYYQQKDYYRETNDKYFLENATMIKNIKFHLHSQNPVGVANMRRIIERNGWEEVK